MKPAWLTVMQWAVAVLYVGLIGYQAGRGAWAYVAMDVGVAAMMAALAMTESW